MQRIVVFGALTACVAATSPTETTKDISAEMSWKGWVFLVVVLAVFVSLWRNLAPMFSIMASSTVVLYVCQVLHTNDVFAGLTNNGVLSVALLFILVHPISELPILRSLVRFALKGSAASGSLTFPLLKLCAVCLFISPFIDNTPHIAVFTPLVTEFAKESNISPSQVLMPMAFAVILGNYFTIGASANLIVSGMMEEAGLHPLPIYELAKVNLPLALPALLYLIFMPKYLLPDRKLGHTFLFRLKIGHNSWASNQKLEDVFSFFVQSRTEETEVVRIVRREHTIDEPFCLSETVVPGDEIIISGRVNSLPSTEEEKSRENSHCPSSHQSPQSTPSRPARDVQTPTKDQLSPSPRTNYVLVGTPDLGSRATSLAPPAMLEHELADIATAAIHPLLPHMPKLQDFAARYGVMVLCLKTSAEGIDCLSEQLSSTLPNMASHESMYVPEHVRQEWKQNEQGHHDTSKRMMVFPSWVPFGNKLGGGKVFHLPLWYPYVSLVVFGGVLLATLGGPPLSHCCLVGVCLLVVLGLATTKDVVKRIPVDTFILNGFSFPLGIAMRESGFAGVVAHAVASLHLNGFSMLLATGVLTILLTNLITNQGALQVMVPLVLRTYQVKGMNPVAGLVMVASTVSLALCTPFGAPPNAMIIAPGRYLPKDFVWFGLPLSILLVLLMSCMCASVYGEWV